VAIVDRSTNDVLAALEGGDFSPMARNSPELKGIEWVPYIRLSAIRVARALAALKAHAAEGARVLDFGAYFGNFSLALARAGYAVDAVDAYAGPFGGALAPFVALMREAGVGVLEIGETGYDFAGIEPEKYDAVLFMGAIEHVPHTARVALEAINRVLRPGGLLVLDTPNLGYVYNRRKFASGETVFPPIEHQFWTEVPFFGHHREYLPGEVRWMLEHVGHEVVDEDMFNYSVYGMTELRGEHLGLWRLMQEHPQLRELIFAVSRKLVAAA
jgi:SAM-dependent methyltransferase